MQISQKRKKASRECDPNVSSILLNALGSPKSLSYVTIYSWYISLQPLLDDLFILSEPKRQRHFYYGGEFQGLQKMFTQR